MYLSNWFFIDFFFFCHAAYWFISSYWKLSVSCLICPPDFSKNLIRKQTLHPGLWMWELPAEEEAHTHIWGSCCLLTELCPSPNSSLPSTSHVKIIPAPLSYIVIMIVILYCTIIIIYCTIIYDHFGTIIYLHLRGLRCFFGSFIGKKKNVIPSSNEFYSKQVFWLHFEVSSLFHFFLFSDLINSLRFASQAISYLAANLETSRNRISHLRFSI